MKFCVSQNGYTALDDALSEQHRYVVQALLGFYASDADVADILGTDPPSDDAACVRQLLDERRGSVALAQRVLDVGVDAALAGATGDAAVFTAVIHVTVGVAPSRWSVEALRAICSTRSSTQQVVYRAALSRSRVYATVCGTASHFVIVGRNCVCRNWTWKPGVVAGVYLVARAAVVCGVWRWRFVEPACCGCSRCC